MTRSQLSSIQYLRTIHWLKTHNKLEGATRAKLKHTVTTAFGRQLLEQTQHLGGGIIAVEFVQLVVG